MSVAGTRNGGGAAGLLSGETRIIPIVGDPIGQVKSPASLTGILFGRSENAMVVPAHVAPPDLAEFMRLARLVQNVDGIIVTVPHKIAALGHCDALTDRARFIGAVNVLRRQPDNSWLGDNLDGIGFIEGCRRAGFGVADKSVLIAGAGGAGSAIAFEALRGGALRVVIHDVDRVRRAALVERLSHRFPDQVAPGGSNPEGFDLVVNATPMGMEKDDPMPFEARRLARRQFVGDVITRPEVSPLVQSAREIGCATMTGAGMFDAQSELLVDFLLGAPPAGLRE